LRYVQLTETPDKALIDSLQSTANLSTP